MEIIYAHQETDIVFFLLFVRIIWLDFIFDQLQTADSQTVSGFFDAWGNYSINSIYFNFGVGTGTQRKVSQTQHQTYTDCIVDSTESFMIFIPNTKTRLIRSFCLSLLVALPMYSLIYMNRTQFVKRGAYSE